MIAPDSGENAVLLSSQLSLLAVTDLLQGANTNQISFLPVLLTALILVSHNYSYRLNLIIIVIDLTNMPKAPGLMKRVKSNPVTI